MRIAQVSPYDLSYHGGVVAHMTSLSRELTRRGHEVVLFAPCAKPQTAPDVSGLEVVPLGGSVPFNASGSVSRISMSFGAARQMRRILTSDQFDIVHIHEPLMPFLGTAASWFSPWPTVGTFHAYSENIHPGYLSFKPLFTLVADKLDGRIAVSNAAKAYADRYFPDRYTIIPNGIDVPRFEQPRPKPSEFRDDAINIVFVGRVGEKRKGLRFLLGAYSTLRWRYPNLRLIVVGAGIPDRESWRMMGERGIDDVIFAGPVTDDELPAYYQHADVFCAPNTGHESFGLVLVEAMASGAPIVASRILGFEGVADHEKDALLVDVGDEYAIANSIQRLIEDPNLRNTLVRNGHEKVQRFGWARVADDVIDYYHQVMARAPYPAVTQEQRTSSG